MIILKASLIPLRKEHVKIHTSSKVGIIFFKISPIVSVSALILKMLSEASVRKYREGVKTSSRYKFHIHNYTKL